MKALRLYGANDIRLDEVSQPHAQPGGMVVKVEACAICGSDLRNIRAGGSSHGMTLPVTLGHEMSATIYELGEGTSGYSVGEGVVLSAIIPCGRCRYCLSGMLNQCDSKETLSYQYDGGFAEYMAIPKGLVDAGGVLKIPNGISIEEAAITEPCSCALNGQDLSRVGLGDTVCVMGAGPLGIIHCALARLRGAGKVILVDVVDKRLELAKNYDEIDLTIDGSKDDVVARVMAETDGAGADVVIVASPANIAQVQGVQMAAKHGRVNLFGGLPKGKSETTFDSNIIHYRELFVHGTSDSTITQMQAILALMGSGRFKPGRFISKFVPLTEFEKAFELASSGQEMKVVIQPGK